MSREYLIASVTLLILAFVQNVSFSVVSRSRNRNNMKFHLVAAFFSNSIWFLTFRELVTRDMSLVLFPWYCAGTMLGSVLGVRISMWIERHLGATSDGHLKKDALSGMKADLVFLKNAKLSEIGVFRQIELQIQNLLSRIGAIETKSKSTDPAPLIQALDERLTKLERAHPDTFFVKPNDKIAL